MKKYDKDTNQLTNEQLLLISKALGNKLKIERITKNESLLGLSLNLDMQSSHISRVERGINNNPTIKTYLNLCKGLNIKPSELFSLIDDLPPFK